MKIIYYRCDLCQKSQEEMAHWNLAGQEKDMCNLCSAIVSEAITKAIDSMDIPSGRPNDEVRR
jgi:hypothetical protein